MFAAAAGGSQLRIRKRSHNNAVLSFTPGLNESTPFAYVKEWLRSFAERLLLRVGFVAFAFGAQVREQDHVAN
jgi:hypothetical protein